MSYANKDRWVWGLLFAGVWLVTIGCSSPEPAQDTTPPPADLVMLGGVVATLDDRFGMTQALAVRGHTIAAVGMDEQIQALVGPDTQVINLNGRFVMPGFIEGHGHFLSLGRAQQILDLTTAHTWQDIVGQVAVAADAAEPGAWIFGRGWHQDKWATVPEGAVEGVPLNTSLNQVAPNNPVLLGHASAHAAFANDAALAAAGIDAQTADPAGGTIVRDANGKATGLLRETAQRLLDPVVEAYGARRSSEEVEANLREQVYLAGREALAHGVTSFHDAGVSFDELDFLLRLEAADELPVRLYAMVRSESNAEMDARLSEYLHEAGENDFLTVRSIKRQIDGALGSHGAWLLAPYADLEHTSGLVLETVEDIEETARIALKHGYQVNTHAIGDRANRETLDLYTRAFEAAGVDGHSVRWRVEHAQHIHPDDVSRFGALGVIASIQGVHCTSDGPWVASRLGEERARATSYPWRDLIDTGAVVTNGTDVPVESINAIASVYASVTRMTRDGTAFFPHQAMTRDEALRSYTVNNAYAAFEDHTKGKLVPGMLADVVVLSHNLLTVPTARMLDTTVDMTVLGGQVVYEKP